MEWLFDDGGRKAAGFKGVAGDCAARSIAIATRRPYLEVYEALNEFAAKERTGKRKRGKSSARTGVYTTTIRRYMKSIGWKWIPTMAIGSGCKVHLTDGELPNGRLVVSVSRHLTAVIEGEIRDTFDPQRDDKRCVYGYFVEG
jgi:hypothetical protein